MIQLNGIIRLKDMFSRPLKNSTDAMEKFEKQTKTITGGVRSAGREMSAMSGRGGKLSGAFGSMAASATGLSTALAGVGAGMVAMNSVNLAMEFESQLSTIGALTGLAGKEMAEMKDLALEMGAKTKYEECFTAA